MTFDKPSPDTRSHGRSRLCVMTAAILAVITPRALPLLVWNATASAPVGLYVSRAADPLSVGELVLAKAPEMVRPLAARRGYLPLHVYLVKRIAALSGDRICSFGNRVSINGRALAMRLAFDTHHRPLLAWHGCRVLGTDEVFLLMAGVPDSFDSRYFGPIRRKAIVAKLRPIWRP